jgi:hypothetical protein
VSEPGMNPNETDHFERIQRLTSIDREREIVARYVEGIAFYQSKIEDHRYAIGRIDERLGG